MNDIFHSKERNLIIKFVVRISYSRVIFNKKISESEPYDKKTDSFPLTLCIFMKYS